MTPGLAGLILRRMDRAGTVRIAIELEPHHERVCGWLTSADGERQRFESWLELATSVQELRPRRRDPPSAPADQLRAERVQGAHPPSLP